MMTLVLFISLRSSLILDCTVLTIRYRAATATKEPNITSYAPGPSISGQRVATVVEAVPLKFLGKKIYYKWHTPSLVIVIDNFINYLNQVDQKLISNIKQVWIYNNYLILCLNWPFLVCHITKPSSQS